MKSPTEWATEELLNQAQRNFSGHLAIFFGYLQEKGLSVDDFVEYVGVKVSSRWKSVITNLQDALNAILFNVLANGEKVVDVFINKEEATATVTGLFSQEIMKYYGCQRETYDRFWNKFKLIANDVGLSFSWENTRDGNYKITLGKRKF
jgi:hypothetical protein